MVAAACVTVRTRPLTSTEPLRSAVVGLAATVYVTDPDPVPEPDTVIQETADPADHAHPSVAVTVIVAVPPPAGAFAVVGVIEYVHAAAPWLTWNVRPATVSVPLLVADEVFAAMLNADVPLPAPVCPLVTVIQAALLVVVQTHAAAVETATEPIPPAAVTV